MGGSALGGFAGPAPGPSAQPSPARTSGQGERRTPKPPTTGEAGRKGPRPGNWTHVVGAKTWLGDKSPLRAGPWLQVSCSVT